MFCFVVVAIVVSWCMYVSWCTYVCMYVVFGKCPCTGIHAFWYNPFLCNWINQIIINQVLRIIQIAVKSDVKTGRI